MKQKIKKIIISLITFYQKIISPDSGFLKRIGLIKSQTCVFYPTCSEYTKQALGRYGLRKGLYLGILRILRCHPWQKKHIDPLK